jgi:hypothetical protein
MPTNNRFLVLMENPIDKIAVNTSNKNNVKTNEKNIDNTKTENKFNSFKNNKQFVSKNNHFENRRRSDYDIRRFNSEDKIKKAKEEEIKVLTNLENFPELKSSTTNKDKNINEQGIENNGKYCNKLLNVEDPNLIKENKNGTNDEEDDYIPDGCICIKFDKKRNKELWYYGKELVKNSHDNIKNDYESPIVTFSRLSKLHKNRRNEYIRRWGINEYNYMFMFPNYDYQYYDKVDEIYENEKTDYSSYYEDDSE